VTGAPDDSRGRVQGLPAALVAAAVWTTAISVSQLLEMRVTGRPPSYTPAQTLSLLTGRPVPEEGLDRANSAAHPLFRANWALAYPGLRRVTGRSGVSGAALLFAVVWPAEVAAGVRAACSRRCAPGRDKTGPSTSRTRPCWP